MINWKEVLTVAIGVVFAFAGGWATAILIGTDGTKALASGVVAATTYYLGNRQEKVTFKS